MQPLKPDGGQADGMWSSARDVTPYEPVSEAVRITLLVGLPFFAINAMVKSVLIYSVFNFQDMKKYRICMFLRFLAIVDCMLMFLLFGVPWVGMLLPLVPTLDSDIRGKLCSVVIYLKITLVDLVTYGMLLAGLERLYCLVNKPYRSYSAVAFVSQHQCRVHNIFARFLLVVFVPVIMAFNLPHLCGKWPESAKDSRIGECFDPWKIFDEDNEDATTIRNHSVLGYCVCLLVMLMGWGMKCTKHKASTRTTQKARNSVKKGESNRQKETSFSHPAGENTDTQPIIQPPAEGAPASHITADNFFKIYLTVQICKLRGHEVGVHLVTCDKSSVPPKKRDTEFNNMVLGYALIYMVFLTPQLALMSFGNALAPHCDLSTMRTLAVATDLIAGNRPAFVFFLYTLMSIEHFGNIVFKILKTAFSCSCFNRRSRYEETITLSVVNSRG